MSDFLDYCGELDNLWTASSNGDIQRVKSLIESGENSVNDQDENGYSPVHAAVSYGHISLLQYLLSINADIRLKDVDGDEPIHYCEDPQVFEFLIENGADPTVLNYVGEDLFQKAIDDENEIMVNYLISKGLGQASDRLPHFEFRQEESNNTDDEVDEILIDENN